MGRARRGHGRPHDDTPVYAGNRQLSAAVHGAQLHSEYSHTDTQVQIPQQTHTGTDTPTDTPVYAGNRQLSAAVHGAQLHSEYSHTDTHRYRYPNRHTQVQIPQQTHLCMQEIDNCQRLSMGPSFIVSTRIQTHTGTYTPTDTPVYAGNRQLSAPVHGAQLHSEYSHTDTPRYRYPNRHTQVQIHQQTHLCMQEIDNCQRLSMGPSFIVSTRIQTHTGTDTPTDTHRYRYPNRHTQVQIPQQTHPDTDTATDTHRYRYPNRHTCVCRKSTTVSGCPWGPAS